MGCHTNPIKTLHIFQDLAGVYRIAGFGQGSSQKDIVFTVPVFPGAPRGHFNKGIVSGVFKAIKTFKGYLFWVFQKNKF